MPFIHVLVNLKHISFVIKGRIDCLMEWREAVTGQVDYRSVDLFDYSDKRVIAAGRSGEVLDLNHGDALSSLSITPTRSKGTGGLVLALYRSCQSCVLSSE